MSFVCMRIGVAIAGVAALIAASASQPTFAQGTEPKPPEQRPADNGKDAKKKVDEYAEAARRLGGGPAANPECIWLGQRFVSLLWHDDLDTAFRHLDLYDRFGCPSGHIQTTFRCVVRQTIDPKAADVLKARISECWLNPDTEAPAASAAAAASPPAQAQ